MLRHTFTGWPPAMIRASPRGDLWAPEAAQLRPLNALRVIIMEVFRGDQAVRGDTVLDPGFEGTPDEELSTIVRNTCEPRVTQKRAG